MAQANQNTYEIMNVWESISIWCLNHDTPCIMEITQNTEQYKTPFYACVNRAGKISNKHPCANRLNLDDYQGVILKFLDMVSHDSFSDFTNKTFIYKRSRHRLFVKVLKYDDKDIRLGIKNTTILGG